MAEPTHPMTARPLLDLVRGLPDVMDSASLTSEERGELASSLRRLARGLDPDSGANGSQQAKRRERAARVYFDYAITGILETDAQWRIQAANPAAASITGHDARRLAGMDLTALPAPEGQAKADRHLALLAEQGISQAEWPLRRRDGREIIIEIASVQVDDDHYVHVLDDVTAQRQSAANIERARAEAEAANRAKSEFLANISHEIRTPLNGIIGLSRLALMNRLDPQQRDYLEKIAQSGRSLLSIINDLLDYAKIEAGRMEFEHLGFSLHELLDELATTASQLPASQDLEVVFHLDPGVPDQIVGDRLRLGQCLNNLISNAIKFTPTGRVELSIRPGGDAQGQYWLDFTFLDTGIGMTPEFLSRLFLPFSQADAGTTRRFGGTGLGLAITRELAEGMGGSLQVESTMGKGSRFTLHLPFRAQASEGRPPPNTPQGTAMILCEREATRTAVEALLAARGWRIADTAHGNELEAGSIAPGTDLILVDCAQAPERLQQLQGPLAGPLAGVPLLVLTGAATADPCPTQWRERDHAAQVTRPLTPNGLQRALRRLGFAETQAPASEQVDNIPLEFSGAHVLVVEDNRVNQTVLMDLLHRAGIKTTLAQDGREALDCLDMLSTAPDLILMDVQMPVMDGLQATRLLRQRGLGMPVIGVSAGAHKGEQAACIAAGMSDFLPKPIDPDELWGCLTRWLPPGNAAFPPPAPVPETAKSRFLGDTNILARARQAFVEFHAGDARDLLTLLANGDLQSMKARAHALKGAAATVGAEAVAALARDLELSLADATAPDTLPDLIARLEAALLEFISQSSA